MTDLEALTQAALIRFRACEIHPGDRVVILASTANDDQTVEAYRRAAVLAGCDPLLITYLERPRFSGLHRIAVQAASEADVVADMNPAAWENSPDHTRVVQALHNRRGRWVWSIGFDTEHANFLKTPPHDPLVMARSRRLTSLLDNAKQVTIRSSAGTNLTIARGDSLEQPSNTPLYWKGGGVISFSPLEQGIEGPVALEGVLRTQSTRLYERQVSVPVKFQLQGGSIVEIQKTSVDARFLQDWIDSLEDNRELRLTEIRFGFDHRVLLSPLDIYAHSAYLGGILLRFGSASSPESQAQARRVEMLLLGNSCWFDETRVIDNGFFTSESELLNPL